MPALIVSNQDHIAVMGEIGYAVNRYLYNTGFTEITPCFNVAANDFVCWRKDNGFIKSLLCVKTDLTITDSTTGEAETSENAQDNYKNNLFHFGIPFLSLIL